MTESQIEKKVCDYVKSKGGIAYKFVSPSRRSVPDRMIVLPNGVLFFIEFKKPGGKLTSGQEREIMRLRNLGQTVYVVDDVREGERTVYFESEIKHLPVVELDSPEYRKLFLDEK